MTVRRDVTTWYLEMRERAALKRPPVPSPAPRIERVSTPSPALNRFLYTFVGGDWYWLDRLPWSWARWMQWLGRPEVQTWVMYVDHAPAGYVELEKQGDDVEIAYFGIARPFFGRKLGGHLLGVGIEKAWDMGARRVWVHTCSLDHPAALANYRARGMTLYKEETTAKDLPDAPPGPWPGAWDESAPR